MDTAGLDRSRTTTATQRNTCIGRGRRKSALDQPADSSSEIGIIRRQCAKVADEARRHSRKVAASDDARRDQDHVDDVAVWPGE